jgi:hypothetical protein
MRRVGIIGSGGGSNNWMVLTLIRPWSRRAAAGPGAKGLYGVGFIDGCSERGKEMGRWRLGLRARVEEICGRKPRCDSCWRCFLAPRYHIRQLFGLLLHFAAVVISFYI